MFSSHLLRAAGASGRLFTAEQAATTARSFATVAHASAVGRIHKVVVVGGGTAGMTVGHQLLRSGRFAQDDIAIVDPAEWHHYQPGWTLVGGGLASKEDLRRPLRSLVDPKVKLYSQHVDSFAPEDNTLTLGSGDKISYEQLVVVPGIRVNFSSIKGLPEALADKDSPVSSIYSYDSCDKVFTNVQRLQKGAAIFTQPTGVLKCAGAPQKAMWMSLDRWRKTGLYNPENPSDSDIRISFATGLPVMFGVPKYSVTLERLRQERGVEGLFQHDLISIDGNKATFSRGDEQEPVTKNFDFLHAVPKMGPHDFVKNSPLANTAGFVDVDDSTTQHKKYTNVWSVGDASSLPTSKTAAAVTSQAPILVQNLLRVMDAKDPDATYDGYTACPVLTDLNKVLLAEFKYGNQPKETFGAWLGVDQATPRRAFFHLKKDFFPWVYYNSMVSGTWAGPNGWIN